jgi:hypothetical protein
MPRDGYFLLEGFDPVGQRKEFYVEANQVKHLLENGPPVRCYELISAAMVLKHPIEIWEDLKRDGKENAICYIGRPSVFTEETETESGVHAAPEGMVFLVFISRDVVFEWGWETADPSAPTSPKDCKRRFGKRIWNSSNT